LISIVGEGRRTRAKERKGVRGRAGLSSDSDKHRPLND